MKTTVIHGADLLKFQLGIALNPRTRSPENPARRRCRSRREGRCGHRPRGEMPMAKRRVCVDLTNPACTTPEQRLGEVGVILAAGVLRMRERQQGRPAVPSKAQRSSRGANRNGELDPLALPGPPPAVPAPRAAFSVTTASKALRRQTGAGEVGLQEAVAIQGAAGSQGISRVVGPVLQQRLSADVIRLCNALQRELRMSGFEAVTTNSGDDEGSNLRLHSAALYQGGAPQVRWRRVPHYLQDRGHHVVDRSVLPCRVQRGMG